MWVRLQGLRVASIQLVHRVEQLHASNMQCRPCTIILLFTQYTEHAQLEVARARVRRVVIGLKGCARAHTCRSGERMHVAPAHSQRLAYLRRLYATRCTSKPAHVRQDRLLGFWRGLTMMRPRSRCHAAEEGANERSLEESADTRSQPSPLDVRGASAEPSGTDEPRKHTCAAGHSARH